MMLQQIQGFGVLCCVVLLGFFAAKLIMILQTPGDSHLYHGPKDGCRECADK